MQGLKRFHLLGFLSFLLFRTSLSEEHPSSHCGGIGLQPPLSSHINSSSLSRFIVCESGRTLYFRTSIGLFRISGIDYRRRLLTIVIPHHMSAGFASKISGKFELGTRISFDVPDHVPNLCDECRKRGGDCGVGLRCVCQLENCKDKVFSVGAALRPCGDQVFFCLVALVVVMAALRM